MKTALVFAGWLLLLAAPLLAQVNSYYVATTGNDSTGTGAQGNPWKTIQKAINSFSLNTGGAVIHVAEGTYTDDIDARTLSPGCPSVGPFVPFCVNKGGSSNSARLVVRCDTAIGHYGCKLAALPGTSSAGPAVSGTGSGVSYVDISGFEYGNFPSAGVGISVMGPPDIASGGTSIHILYNYVHDVGQTSGSPSGCPQSGAISASHGLTGLWVIGNFVNHYGSTFVGDPHGVLTGCSTTQGLYMAGTNALIQNNLVGNVPSNAIVIASPCGNVVSNNVVFGARQSGIYEDVGTGNTCARSGFNTVANNIAVNNGAAHDVGRGYGIKQANDVIPHDPAEFSNNILRGNWPDDTIAGTVSGDVVSANITSEIPPSTFVNYQDNGSGNYQLRAGSLAIDGATTTCVTGGISPCMSSTDILGISRPQGRAGDIGAYESAPVAPGAPTSLTVTPH